MSYTNARPTDKELKYICEDKLRWESYEFFEDEDGKIWVRWSNSGSHYQAGEHTVEWFKEGFDVPDKNDFDSYTPIADDITIKNIRDKIKDIKECVVKPENYRKVVE